MLFKNIAVLDENFEVKQDMFVGIKGDRIDYIGSESPEDIYDYAVKGNMYNGRGKLLMSAFYNAHSHSPMTLLRGYGENLSLQNWLFDKIFPFEAKLDGNAVYWGTLLAMAESIRQGIVSSTDMYDFVEDMARAVIESGAKMNLSRGVTNFTGTDPTELVGYKESEDFVSKYNGRGMGRLLTDVSIHAEYTSDSATCKALKDLAKTYGAGMHIHLSETKKEHEDCKEKYGKTPARYMYDLGVFDVKTTAAHCVWLEGEDFDLLAEKGVTVATCMVSNMKLASGIANIPKMLESGINVAIGTDSVASNNSLNFLEEMKVLALAAKVRDGDPTAITPKEVLTMATLAGAKSQGRKGCGQLKEGNKADLIVLNLDKPHMMPVHNLLNNLVYSAGSEDIVLTMCDGDVLYRNGDFLTIDIEKTMFEVRSATEKILKQL